MPKFADEAFTSWFKRREMKNVGKPKVMLWADTFNNYFFPDVLKAAVDVLEDAGYRVIIPQQALCCGRPLYDWGMMEQAQGLWRQTLKALQPQIEEETPLVGLEPSCVAAFRDELVNLYPNDDAANRLSKQTFMLSEFLMRADARRLPTAAPRREGVGTWSLPSQVGAENAG